MLKNVIIMLFVMFQTQAKFEKAPLEWLIAQSVQIQSFGDHDHGEEPNENTHQGHEHHQEKVNIVNEIFKVVDYDSENDEIIIPKSESSEKIQELRNKLIQYVSVNELRGPKTPVDPLYRTWKAERRSPRQVDIQKYDEQRASIRGHYYFNHIHTNISQDNKSLKLLKFTPEKTYKVISKFVKKRNTIASTAIADHRTDIAYSKLKPKENDYVHLLRGVEWGGSTHMGLIGIKKDWDLLFRGNEFKGEESIIKSRTSEGFRIINHPNRKNPFSYKSWLDVNGVEVWNTILENAPFYQLGIKRSDNRGAKKQWESALKDGKKYVAVGGSDFHFTIPCMRDRTMHYPANFIPSDDVTKTKNNLMKGNVSFLTRPTAPKLSLYVNSQGQNDKVGMGDTLQTNGQITATLLADFSDSKKRLSSLCYNTIITFARTLTFWKKERWEIRFYNKKSELIAKKEINPRKYKSGKSIKATFEYNVSGSDLIRAELWSINKKHKVIDLLGATNPVYLN